MVKEAEIRTAIDNCEKRITEQVKRRTNRDKGIIRECQVEHAKLTSQLAAVLKDNREETVDTKDETGEKYRKEQEKKQEDAKIAFEKNRLELEAAAKVKLEAEAQAKKEADEVQRLKDLNIKKN